MHSKVVAKQCRFFCRPTECVVVQLVLKIPAFSFTFHLSSSNLFGVYDPTHHLYDRHDYMTRVFKVVERIVSKNGGGE